MERSLWAVDSRFILRRLRSWVWKLKHNPALRAGFLLLCATRCRSHVYCHINNWKWTVGKSVCDTAFFRMPHWEDWTKYYKLWQGHSTMHIYSSLLLANLLVTGLPINSPNVEYYSNKIQQSDSLQQQLLVQEQNNGSDCPGSGQSDSRGCPRR